MIALKGCNGNRVTQKKCCSKLGPTANHLIKETLACTAAECL